MTEAHQDSPQPAPRPQGPGPGAMLRQARQQIGVSLEDLAAQLKLNRHALDALERDDFATLQEPVYVRGYYRKLAKVLPVVEADLLRAYDGMAPQKAPTQHPANLILSGSTDLDPGPDWGGMLPWIVAVIVGLGVGGGLWWHKNRQVESPVAETTLPANTEPTREDEVILTPAPTAEVALTTEVASAAGPSVAAPTTTGATAAATELEATAQTAVPAQPGLTPDGAAAAATTSATPTTAPAVAPAPAAVGGAGDLVIQTRDAVWVSVTDATGAKLAFAEKPAGETLRFTGTPPYQISVGRAAAVSVSRNGKPVDLAPFTKASGTAKLTLE